MDFWNTVLRFSKTIGRNSRKVLIEEGDSLWTISEKYDVCFKELQDFNNLKDDLIYAGEYLHLPPSNSKKKVGLPLQVTTLPVPPSETPPAPQYVPKCNTRPIVVQEGDTAWDISLKFGITLEELAECNEIISDMIYPGDILNLPEHVFEPKMKSIRFQPAVSDFKLGSPEFDFFDVFPRQKEMEEYRKKLRGLLDGMRQVETSFIMPAPKGDDGLSIGPLQISEDYHSDAWWLSAAPEKYEKCEDVEHAEKTVINYWLRYVPWAVEFDDFGTLAKIHNGGPRFWRHVKTAIYWRKVKSAMRKFGYYKGIPELDPLLSNNVLCTNGIAIIYHVHVPFGLPFMRSKGSNGNYGAAQEMQELPSPPPCDSLPSDHLK